MSGTITKYSRAAGPTGRPVAVPVPVVAPPATRERPVHHRWYAHSR